MSAYENYPDGVSDRDIDLHFGPETVDLDTVSERYLPEEVFSHDQLSEWARENGFGENKGESA